MDTFEERERKASQWQIGDWCQFKNGSKIRSRINCISPHQRYAGHTDNATWFDKFDEIEGIPLTEEILKANGFNIRRDAYYLSCGFLGNDWERSGVEVKFYDRAVIDIECNYFKHTNRIHLVADYVHELQHALRLCGLNDLADNFKLK